MSVREVMPALPHAALPEADWADCFEMLVSGPPLSAETVARQAFERMPSWVDGLMRIRNILVRPFGLKRDSAEIPAEMARVGFFPVISQTDRELVLGFDDSHLDFRIVVRAEPAGAALTRASMMTLIRRHNLLGKAYLAAIMPFHRLIVRRSLGRVGR